MSAGGQARRAAGEAVGRNGPAPRVRLTRRGLDLDPGAPGEDRRELQLLSGSMHYWRIERGLWDRCLGQMADLGYLLVTAYVPWGVHELDKGRFDFGGRAPEHDLAAFVRAAAGRGLKVALRPGPHINAELTRFGFPARLLDRKELLARGPDGGVVLLPYLPRMFPVPSYAARAFYDEVGIFFNAFAREIRDLLWPDGPVVLLQADNEMCLFFRAAPYDQDYHPEAVALYRGFLRERYADSIAALSRTYGRSYRDWDSLYPPAVAPAQAGDLPPHRDWMEFKGYLMAHGVRRTAELLADSGLDGLPRMHNLPGAVEAPFDVARMEDSIDAVGLDYYTPARAAAHIRDTMLGLDAAGRFPWLPEFSGGGFIPWGGTRTPDDMTFCLGVAYACGARGVNLFMAVERDRFYGAAITARGALRPAHADAVRRMLGLLARARLHELERQSPVLLLARRADAIDACLANPWSPLPRFLFPLAGLPPALAVDPGLSWGAAALAAAHRVAAWRLALDAAGRAYSLGDTRLPAERLASFPVVVLPAPLPSPPDELDALLGHVKHGAKLITDPDNLRHPALRTRKKSDFVVGGRTLQARLLGKGWVIGLDLQDAEGTPIDIVESLVDALQLETAGHARGLPSGWFQGCGRRVLAAINFADHPAAGTLTDVGPGDATDLRTGENLGLAEGLHVELPGYSVGFWEIA